jgi:hypothetical protein
MSHHQSEIVIRARVIPHIVAALQVAVDTPLVMHLGDTTALAANAIDPYGNVFVAPDLELSIRDFTIGAIAGARLIAGPHRGRSLVTVKSRGVAIDLPLQVMQLVVSIRASDDTIHLWSLGAESSLDYIVRDDRGRLVADTVVAISGMDTTIVRLTDGRVRSVATGATALQLAIGAVTTTVIVEVEQRIASLRFGRDTIRFDALFDTTTVRGVAEDSLGSAIPYPRLVLLIQDERVVKVAGRSLQAITPGKTTAILEDPATGIRATGAVIVDQRITAIDLVPLTFDALGDTIAITATTKDRLGSVVVGPQLDYSVSDSTVTRLEPDGRLRSVGVGSVVLSARDPASGTATTADVVVSQRVTTIVINRDTIAFDALGDSSAIEVDAFDRLGSLVGSATAAFSSGDTNVVSVTTDGIVRTRGNGTAVVIAQVAELKADVFASVHQLPTRIIASLKTADSVVGLPIGSIIPVACEARDRNDYVVAGAVSVEPSSGARWIGSQCDSLRALRSGFDTLRLTAGPARASLGLFLVVNPPELTSAAPVVARATAGPDEAFVSWIGQDTEADAAAGWVRILGASSWDQKDVPRGSSLLDLSGGYAPGTNLEISLAFTDVRGLIRGARRDTVTVGDGNACRRFAGYAGTDLRVFCTGDDLLAWVDAQGLDPQTVRCGNESLLALRDRLPNCVYQNGSEHLVLLRGLDDRFRPSPPLPRPLLSAMYLQTLFGRSSREATVWQYDPAIGAPLPVARVGLVTGYRSAISWNTEVNSVGMITWFEPPDANGAIAIYHEGHGGEATEIGAETISWLLQRGWSVIALNLPRVPHMYLRDLHSEEENPLWRMLYGIGQVTEWIHRNGAPGRDPVVVAIGNSGGGWASLLYAALDERIDATVVVSGFVPVSQRLVETGTDVGDWEQIDPTTFGVLDYTDVIRLANSRELLLTYSQLDDCCFRLSSADPFALWLVNTAQEAPAKLTTVISSGGQHGLSSEGYVALQELLDRAVARGH